MPKPKRKRKKSTNKAKIRGRISLQDNDTMPRMQTQMPRSNAAVFRIKMKKKK